MSRIDYYENCKAVRTSTGSVLLIDYPHELYDWNLIDGDYAEDNINNHGDFPEEPGIYKFRLKLWVTGGYPDDFDCDLHAENIERISPDDWAMKQLSPEELEVKYKTAHH